MTKINFRDRKDGKLNEEKKIFILENYSSMKSSEICKLLGIEYKTLKSYANTNKLIKDKYHSFEKYLELRKSNKEYNVFEFVGKTKEIKVENLYKSKYGKYKINQDYFSEINNEFNAYWLGFLYADGYNNQKNKSVELCLCEADKGHLLKLLDSVQSDSEIKNKKVRNFDACRVNLCNEKISKDLAEKGCVNNKSLILEFPSEDILPKHLIRHFIRGYFDGDGCIYVNEELKLISVGFVGTEVFLDAIQEVFHKELGLTKTVKSKKGNAFQVNWGGVINSEKIYKFLYKDCNIFLDRKLEKFDILLCLD